MDCVPALVGALDHERGVLTAWLFGSRARGTDHAGSDADVAVILDADDPMERVDLQVRLSRETGLPVQVVDVARAPADLVRRVLRDGILLVDRDRARRVALEVRKRNEYFDMTPIWRRIRRLPPGVAP